jgi:phage-related tail fiber protein
MSLILTQAGLAAYAQADATGVKLQATHMAAGDGGGQAVAHTSDSTALVHETWRGGLQEITVAASGEVEFVAHVPITVGGWYIREVAIYADDVLLAVGSHPELWKPAPESPDKVELVITAPVKFANAATLSLTVDTTKVLASQEHVIVKIEEHNTAPESHAALFAGLSNGLDAHAERTDNPHVVTADQVGAALTGHDHLTEDVSDLLTDPHDWSAAQRYAPAALAINAGAVAWDAAAAPVAVLTLTEDVTAITLTGEQPGCSYELTILQDATGGHSVTWPSAWRWPGGSAPDMSADGGAEDVITLSVRDHSGTPVVRAVAAQAFAEVS